MSSAFQVSVDRDFARFGSKSYAINKINSVEVRTRRPHGDGPIILWVCLAGGAILTASFGHLTGAGIAISLIAAAVFGALAFDARRRSEIVEYQLFLTTSSREAQALSSRDGTMIQNLRDQVEAAIAGHLT